MSKIALQADPNGTGIFTIASPNSNTNRVIMLPDASGTVNVSGLANEVPAGVEGSPAIYPTGDTNTGIRFPAADTVAIETAGVERLRVTSAGLVAIGTTSTPVSSLVRQVIAGNGAYSQYTRTTTTLGGGFIGTDGNGLAFGVHTGTVGSETYTDNVMRIDTAGNVGIGVTPSAWGTGIMRGIQVSSGAAFIGDVGLGYRARVLANAYYDGTNYRYIGSIGAVMQVANGNAKTFEWYNAPNGTAGNTITFTQAMTLDASGNLLVGTTTANGTLSVSPTGQAYTGFFVGAADGFNIACRGGTTTGTAIRILNGSGTAVGSVAYTASATAYNTSSDYRLKENIEPMQNALDKVAQLNPVTYTWKADGSAGQGFIAHELQAVVPDCVTGEKDTVDDEGNPQYQGVDTSFLVATLVKAIQEQQAQIEDLKAEVAILKGASA